MRRTRLCPYCHTTNVRPSHKKNYLEQAVLPLFRVRPYRCEDCDKRFFGRYSNKPAHTSGRGSETIPHNEVDVSDYPQGFAPPQKRGLQ